MFLLGIRVFLNWELGSDSFSLHAISLSLSATNAPKEMASYNSPCAACKFLRRKCLPDCIYAPYFPPEEPQKFASVHKIFGAGNVSKLLRELLPHQREDAVSSLAYEAEARVRDPVYGCVGAITFLQRQVERLQKELDAANADLIRLSCGGEIPATAMQKMIGGVSGIYQIPSGFPAAPYCCSLHSWNSDSDHHGSI